MNSLAMRLGRLVYQKRRYLFYAYDSKQGPGGLDPHVKDYGSWEEIPKPFRKIATPYPWLNVMYYRMKRGKARWLSYSEDGRQLDAYGWIQDWSIFRRRYGAIADRGTMLGYYWTAPAARGRGLYGRLLAHSLALCEKDRPIVIATSPDNGASQRGIEKAGFRSLGEWEGRIFFRWFSQMRRVSGPGGETPHGIS